MKKLNILVAILFWLFTGNLQAQNNYSLDSGLSSLKVTGTSTLHDWHMIAEDYQCSVVAEISEEGKLLITSIDFNCITTSIKSDNSIMDGKAHNALKSDKWKAIKFVSSNLSQIDINGGTIEGKVGGEMEISGFKRNFYLPFAGEIGSNDEVSMKGEMRVKMSDFNIKPPTALMGTIKTGDDIVIHYTFNFKK